MNTNEKIQQYIADNSKLEKHRPYVGMSNIGDCPRVIFRAYKQGINIDYKAHQNAFRGYRIEAIAKEILIGAGIMKPGSERELVAAFDSRYRGHTDGEVDRNQLVEIKSKRKDKFDMVLSEQRLPNREYHQVQSYIHYGGYSTALVFCICPETFDTTTLVIKENFNAQLLNEVKAKAILTSIDNDAEPACTCGRCK